MRNGRSAVGSWRLSRSFSACSSPGDPSPPRKSPGTTRHRAWGIGQATRTGLRTASPTPLPQSSSPTAAPPGSTAVIPVFTISLESERISEAPARSASTPVRCYPVRVPHWAMPPAVPAVLLSQAPPGTMRRGLKSGMPAPAACSSMAAWFPPLPSTSARAREVRGLSRSPAAPGSIPATSTWVFPAPGSSPSPGKAWSPAPPVISAGKPAAPEARRFRAAPG